MLEITANYQVDRDYSPQFLLNPADLCFESKFLEEFYYKLIFITYITAF